LLGITIIIRNKVKETIGAIKTVQIYTKWALSL